LKNAIAIIPARAGSKGVAGKNIRNLGGQPLIAWTIRAALDSKLFSKVIVSTDSEEYARISRSLGAEVPFLRPDDLSSDTATSMSVVFHALDFFSKKNVSVESIALLQVTSPLRTSDDLIAASQVFKLHPGCVSVVSVSECEHSPLFSNVLPDDRSMESFIPPELVKKRRQDLPTYYRINGAIYWGTPDHLRRMGSFLGKGSFASIMPTSRSIDIDSELDFALAESMIQKYCGK
jgi:CMP-N,N'-diacetyllegionaminic acid synthase